MSTLLELRTEIQNHGFNNSALFPASRLNAYINNAYLEICRRVNYYVDEATQTYPTVSGTQDYALPANWGRIRSLLDTDVERELEEVGLRDIDRAFPRTGTPIQYALSVQNLHLYPTPDGVHNLKLRYWSLPTPLAADGDVPTIPVDYHQMLADWAIGRCFAGEDDDQTAQYWKNEFEKQLAMFMADVRFPSTDAPTQIKSMWGGDGGRRGWTR